jgi:bifunctional UDP-N-acetylglucosamine pyrophosphorylase/glucosamine-1-phosphate N-acetyltransferase
MTIRAVVLAAGLGTRMKSEHPKMLHPLGGRALFRYALDAAREATGMLPALVIGHGAEALRSEVGEAAECVLQPELLGTADAVRRSEPLLRGKVDFVLVMYGDMPLLRAATLSRLIEGMKAHRGPLGMLTGRDANARGFGHILRDASGAVQAVVEESEAGPSQRSLLDINPGVYVVRESWLWAALAKVRPSPKGELYLTDLVKLAASEEGGVLALAIDDPSEWIGVNTRVHLAEAEAALRARINRRWMEAGVTMIDPATTYVQAEVEIGADTVILPNTRLEGATRIGRGCQIGPDTTLRDATLGDRCRVEIAMVERARLADEVRVGPFAHLRTGTVLERGVHMGNFGEIKNSTLGPGTKMGHFSYVGDAHIGAEVNIGAGTITCNFDGQKKNATEIGDGAFIGSDTMLVAPLKIGRGARTGAGAVVTRDVADHTLAVGMPARSIRKLAPPKD